VTAVLTGTVVVVAPLLAEDETADAGTFGTLLGDWSTDGVDPPDFDNVFAAEDVILPAPFIIPVVYIVEGRDLSNPSTKNLLQKSSSTCNAKWRK